jgi:uncharacterized protein
MKKYDYQKIRQMVIKIVKDACFSPKNIYTETVWGHHILPVVNHSLILGRQLRADMEVVELAAYLHDIAAISNRKFIEDHHLYGAEMARTILSKTDLPSEKIDKIYDCIFSHRGSRKIKQNNLEAKILASADAMSHFSELADMMYLVYGIHHLKTEEGARWLKEKLERSWKKIMSQGKELMKNDYNIAKKILNIGLGNNKQ